MAVDEKDVVESKSLDQGAGRVGDDSRESLSQGIWDDLKNTVANAVGLGDRTSREPESVELDFGASDTVANATGLGDRTPSREPESGELDFGASDTVANATRLGDRTPLREPSSEVLDFGASDPFARPSDSGRNSSQTQTQTDNMSRDAGGAGARGGGDRPVETPRPAGEAQLAAIHDNPGVTRERERLEADLTRKVPDEAARERMRQDMESFEHRAAAMHPPMNPDEVAKTYREVTRLLEAKDNPDMPSITAADRVVLAEQIVHHAAHPETIDQGAHSTCNVASLENRMFSRSPSAAAELIRQVATEGQYVTRGEPPRTIDLTTDSLTRHPPDGEESHNPPRDGQRSYASQLFQVTAVNVYHQTHELKITDGEGHETVYPPGTVEYVQRNPDAGSRPPTSGELLVDRRTGEPIKDGSGNNIDYPFLNDDPQVDIYNDITGTRPPERGMFLANEGLLSGPAEHVTHLTSEQQLRTEIERAQSGGRLPIIVKVHSSGEPFFSDSGGGRAGGSGGAHVVCITGFDARTGNVQIDNQWGHDSDHAVNIHELYRATLPRDQQYTALERECAEAARAGRPNYGAELEMMRLGKSTGKLDEMSDAEYDRHAIWLTQQIVRDAQENHNGHVDERSKTEILSLLMEAMGDRDRLNRYQKELTRGVCNALDSGNVSGVELPNWYGNHLMEQRAQEIDGAVHWYGNETDKICENLERLTPAEYDQMDQIFRRSHDGKSIEQYLTDKISNEQDRARAMALIRQAQRRT